MRYEITCTKEEKEQFERLQGRYRQGHIFLLFALVLISFLCSIALVGIIQPPELLTPAYWPLYALISIGIIVFCKDFPAYKRIEKKLLEKAEWRELDT